MSFDQLEDDKFVWSNETDSSNFPIFTLKTVPVMSRVIKRSVCKPPVASLIATMLNLSSTFYYPEITSIQYKAISIESHAITPLFPA